MSFNCKYYVNAIAVFVVLFSLSGTSFAEPVSLSLEDLANIFSTYFPKVEGSLSRVEEGRGTINLGEKDGLVKGVVLEVIRPGALFYHPITHEEMGRFEEKLGFLEVDSIEEGESRGSLLYHGKKPETGDRVRISSARISVRISGGTEKNNLVIMDEFSRFLLETDRFLIPSFSKINHESRQPENFIAVLYEFKVQPLSDKTIQIELINLPFGHSIDHLAGTTNGVLQ
jgi:hypothetical protein